MPGTFANAVGPLRVEPLYVVTGGETADDNSLWDKTYWRIELLDANQVIRRVSLAGHLPVDEVADQIEQLLAMIGSQHDHLRLPQDQLKDIRSSFIRTALARRKAAYDQIMTTFIQRVG